MYGPNEYHKGRMASVIFHAYHQINDTGKLKLFCSHKKNYRDGEQLRDFIYVKDVVKVLVSMLRFKHPHTIYNLGSGIERSFNDLAKATFLAMNKKIHVEYIDIPKDIRETYQYFTKANMNKLINTGYSNSFTPLELGVKDYIQNYLQLERFY